MSKFNTVRETNTPKAIPVKQWTTTDHLTHDFLGSKEYQQRCLERYGQYMGRDGVRVTR